MIKKHSKEELKEIQKKYGHWDDSKNQEWVYDLTKERLEEMEGLFGERMDELFNDRLEQLNVKKSSIKRIEVSLEVNRDPPIFARTRILPCSAIPKL